MTGGVVERRGEEEEEEAKWVKHYSSVHDILLVGDGDFSFSLSLAMAFGSASNILATSLDTFDVVTAKYSKAKSNLEKLEALGATIIHGIDATQMKNHAHLKIRRFDRIVFNFPHAGFKGLEKNSGVIRLHRNLVRGFFANARHLLRVCGEVHVSHKTTGPFCLWNLKELASKNSLVMFESIPFRIDDYPGYNNKRGDGKRCDEPFPLGECSTFKFSVEISEAKAARLKPAIKRKNFVQVTKKTNMRRGIRIRKHATLSQRNVTIGQRWNYVNHVSDIRFGHYTTPSVTSWRPEDIVGRTTVGYPYGRSVDVGSSIPAMAHDRIAF